MAVSYSTGSATDLEDLLAEIRTAAVADGWTASVIAAYPGGTGGDVGDVLILDKGDDYTFTLRTVANLITSVMPEVYGGGGVASAAMLLDMEWDNGVDSVEQMPVLFAGNNQRQNQVYIGQQPTVGTTGGSYIPITFPATYHIFVYDDPNMIAIVLQTGAISYQWMTFGLIRKFGTWSGGGYISASGCALGVSTGGTFQNLAAYSLTGESTVRSFAPWHAMDTDFNRNAQAAPVSNSRLHIITGTSEGELDDLQWSYCCNQNPGSLGGGTRVVREVTANRYWSPLVSRSPNSHNEVSVMVPYWLSTPRAGERCIIGRQAHMRHIPIDNFNPGDLYTLHGEDWMVFPYWQREGLTGLHGFAIRRTQL